MGIPANVSIDLYFYRLCAEAATALLAIMYAGRRYEASEAQHQRSDLF